MNRVWRSNEKGELLAVTHSTDIAYKIGWWIRDSVVVSVVFYIPIIVGYCKCYLGPSPFAFRVDCNCQLFCFLAQDNLNQERASKIQKMSGLNGNGLLETLGRIVDTDDV